VLVLQTSNILSEPRPLAGIYGAASFGIPIVPVVLIGSKDEHEQLVYNFETAKVTNPTTVSDVEQTTECVASSLGLLLTSDFAQEKLENLATHLGSPQALASLNNSTGAPAETVGGLLAVSDPLS
jgi:hypothetical protein